MRAGRIAIWPGNFMRSSWQSRRQHWQLNAPRDVWQSSELQQQKPCWQSGMLQQQKPFSWLRQRQAALQRRPCPSPGPCSAAGARATVAAASAAAVPCSNVMSRGRQPVRLKLACIAMPSQWSPAYNDAHRHVYDRFSSVSVPVKALQPPHALLEHQHCFRIQAAPFLDHAHPCKGKAHGT